MPRLSQLDQRFVWHPFTQMRDWLAREPIVIVEGRGAMLRDARGREYLDGNATIWTNLHGHNHPRINTAIRRQLSKIAHVSALGLANEPAALLAARLVASANGSAPRQSGPRLGKVFYSDDGSTAIEVALKLAYEYARRTGRSSRPRFLSLAGAYHGDTVGAVSLGHIDLFHRAYGGLLFRSDQVMAPYCYRCPYNQAQPERADARDYRRCQWECVREIEQRCAQQQARRHAPYAGFVFEPLIQGAAGMIPQPATWLARVTEIVRGHGTLLIADEVMTGFGRTGGGARACEIGNPESGIRNRKSPPGQRDTPGLFACQAEDIRPDFLCLAKGLTGGYLPMAATLTTQPVFDAFLGDYDEFKTFFHGHSFTANPLGAAAALASLDLLEAHPSRQARRMMEATLAAELPALWDCPQVGDVRQVGLVVGVELVRNWQTREPFDLREQAGIRVGEAMARRGVLTRPIGNVVILMPPYCATARQVRRMVSVLREAIEETFS